MNRTDRLMGIVARLQAKKYQQAEQLAEHFGISVRTFYRDLRAMNEIGVPIGFEPGKGYFILGGYFLPPVSLTVQEANALALVEPLAIRFADKEVAGHVATALAKIRMVLGHKERENMAAAQEKVQHYIPAAFEHLLPQNNFLVEIQHSIAAKNLLEIDYENSNGESSVREVEPIGLTFYSLNWHLIAWCHLRKDYRDFRTSRIKSLRNRTIPFRKTDHIELSQYLAEVEAMIPKIYP